MYDWYVSEDWYCYLITVSKLVSRHDNERNTPSSYFPLFSFPFSIFCFFPWVIRGRKTNVFYDLTEETGTVFRTLARKRSPPPGTARFSRWVNNSFITSMRESIAEGSISWLIGDEEKKKKNEPKYLERRSINCKVFLCSFVYYSRSKKLCEFWIRYGDSGNIFNWSEITRVDADRWKEI